MAIILSILLFTGTLGFWQERNAGKAVEKLRAIITVKARVLRNNTEKEVHTGEVVPGRYRIICGGGYYSCRLPGFGVKGFAYQRASLTGETYPALKEAGPVSADAVLSKRKNVLFQGTSVVNGTGIAIAVLTGTETVFGKISKEMEQPAGVKQLLKKESGVSVTC